MSKATSNHKPRGRNRATKGPPVNVEALLTRETVARALGISLRSFDQMVSAGKYPAHDAELNGRRRWRREHHDTWVRRQCKVDDDDGAKRGA